MKRMLQISIFLVLAVMVVVFTGCSNSTNTTSDKSTGSNSSGSYENIDGTQLQELLKDSNTLVVDVREPGEYQSGHIENSILIPLGQITSEMNQLDKSKTIVLVCASGARSAQAAQYLIDNGYTNVKNLQGGVYGNSQLRLVQ